MTEDRSPINMLYFRKDILLFSSTSGRFIALELAPEALQKKEDDLIKTQTHKRLVAIDLTSLRKVEQFLLNPIKRVLQVKLLQCEASNTQLSPTGLLVPKLPEDSSLYFEKCLALVLENNSIGIFSLQSHKIDYILKANDGAILGVFFHPVFDQLFVLTSSEEVNVWSISTGNFERSLSYKAYQHHFALKEFIIQHSKAFENPHSYNAFKSLHSKSISKLHSVLEFNSRADEGLIDYQKEAPCSKNHGFQLNNERFGDLAQIVVGEAEGGNLIWMLNYANEIAFESKSKKNGCACLKLKLGTHKIETHRDVAHILLVDCKQNLENFRRFLESREDLDGARKAYMDYLPFVFPFGVSQKVDEKIFKKIDNRLPVFNFCVGIQGIGESFSFLLRSQDNWSSSSYLSTIQALAITVKYFLIKK